MPTFQGAVRRIKRMAYRPRPSLNPRLTNVERVFRSPALTRQSVKAIRLIAPHLDLWPNEEGRNYWEMEQNGSCWAEYRFLKETLAALPKPLRVLEIGPGLGRSLVFFSKKCDWRDSDLHAYDADGNKTKYTTNGPRY
jgi:hypothetical protein